MTSRNLVEMRENVKCIIQENPILQEFFGTSLETRMEKNDWLKNPVLLFLSGLVPSQPPRPLLIQIETAKSMLDNYDAFCIRELKGDETDFDEKVLDRHAELVALQILNEKGYKRGRYIIPRQECKTPDFEVKKEDGQQALVEVKHKRDPSLPAFLEHVSKGAIGTCKSFGFDSAQIGKILDSVEDIIQNLVKTAKNQLEEYDKYHKKKHIVVICFDWESATGMVISLPWCLKRLMEFVAGLGGEIIPRPKPGNACEFHIFFIELQRSGTIS